MIVWCRSGTDYSLDRVGIDLGLLEQLTDGTRHQIRGACALLGLQDVTCLHADTFHYPLVTGVHDVRQFLVIKDIVRHISAHTSDYGIESFHVLYLNTKPQRTDGPLRLISYPLIAYASFSIASFPR